MVLKLANSSLHTIKGRSFEHEHRDGGYEAQWLRDWVRSVKQTHKIDLELVERTGKGFEVIKQCRKVERMLAWLLNDRRHSRDYEMLTANSEE